MPNQAGAPAPDAVAEIKTLIRSVRGDWYNAGYQVASGECYGFDGGGEVGSPDLARLEALVTALASERDRLRSENERVWVIVDAAIDFTVADDVGWGEPVVGNKRNALKEAVRGYLAATAPPDGGP